MAVIRNITAPNLPIPPDEYDANYIQQLTNTLRLYFNTVSNSVNNLYLMPTVKEVQLTGFSKVIPDEYNVYVIDCAGVLATGTITMPAIPRDTQTVEITSKYDVTALTVSANTGHTLWGWTAGATLSAGIGARFIFTSSDATWNRIN